MEPTPYCSMTKYLSCTWSQIWRDVIGSASKWLHKMTICLFVCGTIFFKVLRQISMKLQDMIEDHQSKSKFEVQEFRSKVKVKVTQKVKNTFCPISSPHGKIQVSRWHFLKGKIKTTVSSIEKVWIQTKHFFSSTANDFYSISCVSCTLRAPKNVLHS